MLTGIVVVAIAVGVFAGNFDHAHEDQMRKDKLEHMVHRRHKDEAQRAAITRGETEVLVQPQQIPSLNEMSREITKLSQTEPQMGRQFSAPTQLSTVPEAPAALVVDDSDVGSSLEGRSNSNPSEWGDAETPRRATPRGGRKAARTEGRATGTQLTPPVIKHDSITLYEGIEEELEMTGHGAGLEDDADIIHDEDGWDNLAHNTDGPDSL